MTIADPTTRGLYEQFGRYPNGATLAKALTGQSWGEFGSASTIIDGAYDSATNAASYLECLMIGRVVRLGGEYYYDSEGGTLTTRNGTVTLAAWGAGGIVAGGHGRTTQCHLALTYNAILYYVRDVVNDSLTLVDNIAITSPIALDTVVQAEVTISGTTATVELSNGQSEPITHATIGGVADGIYASFELYYGSTSPTTDARVRFTKVWGSSTQTQAGAGSPSVVGSAFGSTSTTQTTHSLTLPSGIQDGDQILVFADVLDSTQRHTQTAGPTLTLAAEWNRAGISVAAFKRTAVSGDSGATVTIQHAISGTPTAIAGIISAHVLRGIASVGTVATTSQGSGSSTVTVPAGTAATDRIHVHFLGLGSSSGMAASITAVATNMTELAKDLPASTGRRSGIYTAIDLTANRTPGTTYTNTGTHFAATATIPLTVSTTPAALTTAGGVWALATLTATAVQVGTTTGGLSATAALTAAAVEVEVAAGNIGATATLTGTTVEQEYAAGNVSATAAFTGATVEREITTGGTSATAALTGVVVEQEVSAGGISAVATFAGDAEAIGTSPTRTGDIAAVATLTGPASEQYTVTGDTPATIALTGAAFEQYATTGDAAASVAFTGNTLQRVSSTGDIAATASLTGTHVEREVTNGGMALAAAITGATVAVHAAAGGIGATASLTAQTVAVHILAGQILATLELSGSAVSSDDGSPVDLPTGAITTRTPAGEITTPTPVAAITTPTPYATLNGA